MFLEGPVKADTGAGRISTIMSMFSIHHDVGSRNEGLARLDHERPSSAEQEMNKGERDEREGARFKLIVAIEQWICLVLGVVCVASGIWGVLLKISQSSLPAYLVWLAPEYALTLRITAVACLVMGLVLVRRGLAQF
jgi:hypothetical protein